MVGKVMAPEDLTVGRHSLHVHGYASRTAAMVTSPITFFIDAPGVGACL